MADLFSILTYIRVQRIFEKEKKCRAETLLYASVVDMILHSKIESDGQNISH